MKKKIALIVTIALALALFCGCSLSSTSASGTYGDIWTTQQNAEGLSTRQPTPSDIEYSLERYNLIRRAYWVNGMRERANTLPCEIEKPLGYIVLFSGNATIGSFIVDGKVSSLNSFLTPDSEYYELVYGGTNSKKNEWLADVDGSYGENDSGIFFFTPDGRYVEWSGDYLYSDIPFVVDAPVVRYEVNDNE